MFNLYTNGKRNIKATDKSFDIIYKSQGFRRVGDEELKAKVKIKRSAENEDEIQENLNSALDTSDDNPYEDMTKTEISKLLTQKGIEHNIREKREDLVKLLIGSEIND